MTDSLMVLPATDHSAIRVVRIPPDFEAHEAYRRVTGLIASLEEDNDSCEWEDVAALLEESGFEPVDFVLGPPLG